MTPTEHHFTAEELHNDDVAHEHSDVNLRLIVASGVAMFVVTVISAVVVWGVFSFLERQERQSDPPQSPLAVQPGELPPQPRLQTNEPAGLRKFRESETDKLQGYGWVDEKGGVARIPIEEAKKKLLEHGLPTRATPIDERLGTDAPALGMPSSGRNIPLPAKKQ
jgi:hypothetical protein